MSKNIDYHDSIVFNNNLYVFCKNMMEVGIKLDINTIMELNGIMIMVV
ncbi:hypothetical protein [Clostridium sp. Marseille-Q7071]